MQFFLYLLDLSLHIYPCYQLIHWVYTTKFIIPLLQTLEHEVPPPRNIPAIIRPWLQQSNSGTQAARVIAWPSPRSMFRRHITPQAACSKHGSDCLQYHAKVELGYKQPISQQNRPPPSRPPESKKGP